MDELYELRRRAGLLVERQDYFAMFNDLITANPKVRDGVQQAILWARKTLKKNDRIIWYLRWWRLWAMFRISTEMGQAELVRYNKRFGTQAHAGDIPKPDQLMMKLEHFMSMPVPEIQNHVWTKETPAFLLSEFEQAENEWREQQDSDDSLLDADDSGDEILIQFPDGMAWWHLDREYCNDEGRAMGHCGNSASHKRGETLLSLRKPIKKGDKTYWYPVATFIRDKNGMLGEMKGRANNKPVARYHPYIVELLKHHYIDGIKGGGYAPENNFSLTDLDDKTRDELLALKPDLGDFYSFYKKYGMDDPRTQARFKTQLNNKDIVMPDYDPVKKRFELETWRDFEDFLNEVDDDVCKHLYELATGNEDADDFTKVSDHGLIELLANVPEPYQSKLLAMVKLKPMSAVNDQRLFAEAVSRMKKTELYALMHEAFEVAATKGKELKDRALERLQQYVDEGWYFKIGPVSLEFADEGDILHSAVGLYMDEDDLVKMASVEDGDYDDEYSMYVQDYQNDGWSVVDWEYQNERREEDGLTKNPSGKKNHYDRSNNVDAEFGGVDLDDDALALTIHDAVDALIKLVFGGGSPKVKDPKQHEMTFDSRRRMVDPDREEINELRRRAGLPLLS